MAKKLKQNNGSKTLQHYTPKICDRWARSASSSTAHSPVPQDVGMFVRIKINNPTHALAAREGSISHRNRPAVLYMFSFSIVMFAFILPLCPILEPRTCLMNWRGVTTSGHVAAVICYVSNV